MDEHGAPLVIDDTVATAANVDAFRFADVVTTFTEQVRDLGPAPIKRARERAGDRERTPAREAVQ